MAETDERGFKACPFCGSFKVGVRTLGHRYFVVCECGAEGPCVFGEMAGAIRRWNERIADG